MKSTSTTTTDSPSPQMSRTSSTLPTAERPPTLSLKISKPRLSLTSERLIERARSGKPRQSAPASFRSYTGNEAPGNESAETDATDVEALEAGAGEASETIEAKSPRASSWKIKNNRSNKSNHQFSKSRTCSAKNRKSSKLFDFSDDDIENYRRNKNKNNNNKFSPRSSRFLSLTPGNSPPMTPPKLSPSISVRRFRSQTMTSASSDGPKGSLVGHSWSIGSIGDQAYVIRHVGTAPPLAAIVTSTPIAPATSASSSSATSPVSPLALSPTSPTSPSSLSSSSSFGSCLSEAELMMQRMQLLQHHRGSCVGLGAGSPNGGGGAVGNIGGGGGSGSVKGSPSNNKPRRHNSTPSNFCRGPVVKGRKSTVGQLKKSWV